MLEEHSEYQSGYRHLVLIEDSVNRSPVLSGLSEDRVLLGGFYQTAYRDWLPKLGARIEISNVEQQALKIDGMVYTQLKYGIC